MIAPYVLSSWLVYGHTQDYETASTFWTALSILRRCTPPAALAENGAF
jgi:hypothetical protein